MAGPDYIVDIDGLRRADDPADGSSRQAGGGRSLRGRPWLAVQWRCCSVYSRIYRNAAGDRYAGRCPRCGRPVNVGVAPDGTDSRFFEAC
jgi:hypothetical protein